MSGQETPTEPVIVRLQRRSEFLAAARGARVNRSAFLLQSLPRSEPERGCGATVRRRSHPSFAIDDLGFRLARTVS